jgi:hypothetical protein
MYLDGLSTTGFSRHENEAFPPQTPPNCNTQILQHHQKQYTVYIPWKDQKFDIIVDTDGTRTHNLCQTELRTGKPDDMRVNIQMLTWLWWV